MKTLKPFQEQAVALALEGNLLFLAQCGLGKTFTAVAAIRARQPTGPVLVACRKRARFQWRNEFQEEAPDIPVIVLEEAGRTPFGWEWSDLSDHSTVAVIVHHEALRYALPYLARFRWDTIIADEAHRFKNRKARQTLALKVLQANRKIGLTGTIMDRYPDELWSVVNWLYPKAFPSYWRFRETFCEVKENWAGYSEVVGIKNPEQLARVLEPFTLRVSKEDLDHPPLVMERIEVPMEPKQAKIYADLARSKDIEVLIEDRRLIIPNVLAHLVRLQQVSSDPRLLGFEAPSGKIEWVKDFVADNEEKVVIMTRFRDTAIRLGAFLNASTVVGGADAERELVKFYSGQTPYVVGTIDGLGESIDLPQPSTAIFVDQTYSSLGMQQAAERIDRLGITQSKYIIYLYSSGIDEVILRALDNKWSNQELVEYYLRDVGVTYENRSTHF